MNTFSFASDMTAAGRALQKAIVALKRQHKTRKYMFRMVGIPQARCEPVSKASYSIPFGRAADKKEIYQGRSMERDRRAFLYGTTKIFCSFFFIPFVITSLYPMLA
jgi:hypothetical protein